MFLFRIFLTAFAFQNELVELEKLSLLDELNYARANPEAYGLAIDVDLSYIHATMHLEWDKGLARQAQRYSKFLYENEYLVHSGDPRYRESILWNYDVCNSIKQFIIDEDVPSLAHRKHLLDSREIKAGIGISKGRVGRWYCVYVVILTQ